MTVHIETWLVVIGDPPWHIGPFASKADAEEYQDWAGGTVWPLWSPEDNRSVLQAERDGSLS